MPTGGFFKRQKAKQKKANAKPKRGSAGLSKHDRKVKHNALVDFYSAQRHLNQLKDLSSSSDDGSSGNDSDLDSQEEAALFTENVVQRKNRVDAKQVELFSALGVAGFGTGPQNKTSSASAKTKIAAAGKKRGRDAREEDDEEEEDESDFDSDAIPEEALMGEDEEEEEEEEEDEGEEGEEEEETSCAHCKVNLESEDAEGFACVTCRATFCTNCFETIHQADKVKRKHTVVSLSELNEGGGDDDDEEKEEDMGDDGMDDEDDLDSVDRDMARELDSDDLLEDDDEGAEEDEEEFVNDAEWAKKHAQRQKEKSLREEDDKLQSQAALLESFDFDAHRADVDHLYGHKDPFLERMHKDAFGKPDAGEMKKIEGYPLGADSSTAFNVTAAVSDQAKRRIALVEKSFAAAKVINNAKQQKKKGASTAAEPPRPDLVHPMAWKLWVAYCRRNEIGFTKWVSSSSSAKPKGAAHAKAGIGAAADPEEGQDVQKEEEQECMFRNELQEAFFIALTSSVDIGASIRAWEHEKLFIEAIALHLLNHQCKAQTLCAAHERILSTKAEEKNNKQKKKKKQSRSNNKKSKRGESDVAVDNQEEDDDDDEEEPELRDRGFGRARLMLVLPMRNLALQYMNTLLDIMGLLHEHDEQDNDEEEDEEAALNRNKKRYSVFLQDFSEMDEVRDPNFHRRPPDFKSQFHGNINDSFCFGVSFTAGNGTKARPAKAALYAAFLHCDLVVCSPLGLRKRLARDADVSVALSSIEVAVFDQASTLMMQNWSHVEEVLKMLNKRPTDTTQGLADLRRVYEWALSGRAGRHRQTVVLSEMWHAQINAAFRATNTNAGRIRFSYDKIRGVLPNVPAGVRQHFVRYHASSPQTTDDERFELFEKQLFPQKIQPMVERNVRVIIYVPSYFDFLRIKNFLHKTFRPFFCSLSEYSTPQEQRQTLGQFSDLERPLLLLSERFYFYKRYFVKMAEAMFFYSPPLYQGYYGHLISKLQLSSPNSTVMTLFGRYDAQELVRLVGTERAQQMLTREAETYVFYNQE